MILGLNSGSCAYEVCFLKDQFTSPVVSSMSASEYHVNLYDSFLARIEDNSKVAFLILLNEGLGYEKLASRNDLGRG